MCSFVLLLFFKFIRYNKEATVGTGPCEVFRLGPGLTLFRSSLDHLVLNYCCLD